ncbi:YhcN/YlaJ family sporulation lipoprotein [Bacillus sp. RO1]|uniref:YhcN/YlaJ family sporulation lipoprotein n=1 Tax=Bacillus sp. RO1 TaxID=2722703 RepID=UPI0014567394|nr:YhcN/YlaJ family sporulation lipoprotein [Bacillus sp. RO1]NLP52314.1 sporulation protein [Bacillus sp. RO1]
MRKTIKILAACSLVTAITSACSFDPTPEERQARSVIYGRDGQPMNTNTGHRYDMYDVRDSNNHDQTRFGYVRDQAEPVRNSQRYNENIAAVDYGEIANIINKMVVQLPAIEDSATLVTDEEVLIAYETNSDDRELTADQVSKTGLSIVPRYYHVYISDNPEMIHDIERFRSLGVTSPRVDEILESTIKEMLKSPQGKQLNTGENGNGEADGEMNEESDKSEFRKQMKND